MKNIIPAGWVEDGNNLRQDFKFDDFKIAFDFMRRVAVVAERINHHPDWSNSYNKVSIILTTHDAGGVTEQDLALARRINEIAHNLNELT